MRGDHSSIVWSRRLALVACRARHVCVCALLVSACATAAASQNAQSGPSLSPYKTAASRAAAELVNSGFPRAGAESAISCARTGDAYCQYLLAQLLGTGSGVRQDPSAALSLLNLAERAGVRAATAEIEYLRRSSPQASSFASRGVDGILAQVRLADAAAASAATTEATVTSAAAPTPTSASSLLEALRSETFPTAASRLASERLMAGDYRGGRDLAVGCALAEDAYCLFILGAIAEHGAPGYAPDPTVARRRYEQSAVADIPGSAQGLARVSGASLPQYSPSSQRLAPAATPPIVRGTAHSVPKRASASTRAQAQPLVRSYATTPKVTYRRGAAYYRYDDGPLMVEATVLGREGKLYRLFVGVVNAGNAAANVSTRNFQAAQGPERLRVLSMAEAQKRLDRKQFWENVAVGLAAGADAYATGMSSPGTTTVRGSYNEDVYSMNSGNRYRVEGTVTGTYTDPAARQAALDAQRSRSMAMFDQMAGSHASEDSELSGAYLGDHTLQPGDGYSGYILIQRADKRAHRNQPISLSVSLGERVMRFQLPVPD